ncbi:MAG: DUF6075 family protein [Anaerovoracaceae bacterium]
MSSRHYYPIGSVYFKDSDHKKRLLHLLAKDNTHPDDTERISLFYLMAIDESLFEKFQTHLYDFSGHYIVPKGVEEIDLCSSQRQFVSLGFNLYNNYTFEGEAHTVLWTFNMLNTKNFLAAIESLKICMRYSYDYHSFCIRENSSIYSP